MNGRRQRHNAALNKICTICGRGYTAKRIDPVYCGAACKQKAYSAVRQKSDKAGNSNGGGNVGTTENGNTDEPGRRRTHENCGVQKLIADTRKMIDRTNGGSLFDTLIDSAEIWDNDTCKGYCILAMEGAGYSREQIRDVLRQFSNVFDFVSQDQAEAVYNSFEHGEPTRQEPTRPRRATFTRYNRGQ